MNNHLIDVNSYGFCTLLIKLTFEDMSCGIELFQLKENYPY